MHYTDRRGRIELDNQLGRFGLRRKSFESHSRRESPIIDSSRLMLACLTPIDRMAVERWL
jgi:hypothetical protein